MTSSYYGYSGFYKESYLRSSLEYIYARYLDYMSISWTYEPKTFTLSNGERYKPDFLLETGEYTEIKGSFNYEQCLPKVKCFESDFLVKVNLIQEPDLRILIKSTPLIFEHLKNEWKEVAKVRGMSISGSKNPMYGVVQTDSAKAKISAKAKERFNDPVYRAKWENSPKRKAYHVNRTGIKTGDLVPRYTLQCEFCNSDFVVIQGAAKIRRFCSKRCAIQTNRGKTITTNLEVRELAHNFALNNSDKLFTTKLNKLKPLFQPLYDEVLEAHNIMDTRTIALMTMGKSVSRKEFLYYLRDYVQKVRGTIENPESIELEDKKPLG